MGCHLALRRAAQGVHASLKLQPCPLAPALRPGRFAGPLVSAGLWQRLKLCGGRKTRAVSVVCDPPRMHLGDSRPLYGHPRSALQPLSLPPLQPWSWTQSLICCGRKLATGTCQSSRPWPPSALSPVQPSGGTPTPWGSRGARHYGYPRTSMDPPGAKLPSVAPADGNVTNAADTYIFVQR